MVVPGPGAATEEQLRRRNPFGTHVLVGRGLVAGALAAADRLGCDVIQLFVGNPRGWALGAGDPREDARFRDGVRRRGLRVVLHAPYLVNLGSPSPETYRRSTALVRHQLRRAGDLGAEGVVVHTGSSVATDGGADGGADRQTAALARVREALLPLLDQLTDDEAPWLLLEPTAGQGRSLCARVDDLPACLEALDHHPRAGLCLDTCHAFAAGEALDEPGGTTEVVDRLVAIGGPGRLRLVHANGSLDPRGSARDRHAPLGAGLLGTGAFSELLAHPATDGVPFVLETPGSREVGNPDLRLLERLRRQAPRAVAAR